MLLTENVYEAKLLLNDENVYCNKKCVRGSAKYFELELTVSVHLLGTGMKQKENWRITQRGLMMGN